MSGPGEGPAGKGGPMDRGVAASFLAGLDREVAAVEARLAQLRDLRAAVGRYLSGGGPVGDAPPPPPRRARAPRSPLAGLIADVLREARAPAAVADLRGPLRGRGYGVGMKDAIMYNTIYTTMMRHEDLFARDGLGRWSLTGPGWQFALRAAGAEAPPPPPDDGPDDAREPPP
jgi:hypothetical protein